MTLVAPAPIAVLLSLKARLLRNRVNQLLDESPVRLAVSALFTLIIWGSLYFLFRSLLSFLQRFPEHAILAISYVFHIFFVAMTLLLAFSSAVLCYGTLFTREEPSFLLSGPTPPRQIVAIGYLEALFFSSWALILLGLPLMIAIGHANDLPWTFYALFLATLLAFVPIPGALGLLAAWCVAMFMPRSAKRTVAWTSVAVLFAAVLWWARLWQIKSDGGGGGAAWLEKFLGQLSLLRNALFPSTWASQAVRYALEAHPSDAVIYFFITIANAVFLSWLVVRIVGRWFQPAFARSRSRSGRRVSGTKTGLSAALAASLFPHLSGPVRVLVYKDLKCFFRDPLQWSQLAILFGLFGLYLLYFPKASVNLDDKGGMRVVFGFLNYCAVTLIISTFTSRFVFPMISMEGRQIWLVGLWPLPRASVMWAKFQFALAVTLPAAIIITLLSVRALELPGRLGLVFMMSTASTCVGLCGLAIGLGARLPNYQEASAARVSSGLGGTINLIASLGLVLMSLTLTALICFRLTVPLHASDGVALSLAWPGWVGLFCGLQIALGVGAGIASMKMGIRYFMQAEF